jgi:hypothetical protein
MMPSDDGGGVGAAIRIGVVVDNVASWTRLMTINLFPLQKETPAGIEMMQKREGNRLAEFQKGKIIDRTHFRVMTDVQGCLLSTKPGKAFQKSMRWWISKIDTDHGTICSDPDRWKAVRPERRGKYEAVRRG